VEICGQSWEEVSLAGHVTEDVCSFGDLFREYESGAQSHLAQCV
jgi:hypothetical protein